MSHTVEVERDHSRETFEQHAECGRQLRDRTRAMALTPGETAILVACLAGSAPAALAGALDYVEHDRVLRERRAR